MIDHADYMGMLSLNRRVTDAPVDCLGADIPIKTLIELAFYTAQFNTETRLPEKGELLAQVMMTEAQFSQFILRPGFNDGVPAQLQYRRGYQVAPYDPMQDPVKHEIQATIRTALSDDPQSNGFLKEIDTKVQRAVADGKLSAGDKKDIAHTLNVIADNLPQNEEYYQHEAHDVARKRTQSVLANIRSTLLDTPDTDSTLALPAVENTLPPCECAAMLYASAVSSQQTLFSDVHQNNNHYEMTLSTASTRVRLGSGGLRCYMADREFLRIDMAMETYAQLLQGRADTIPVTYKMREGKRCASVPCEHTQEFQSVTLSAVGDSHRNRVISQLRETAEQVLKTTRSKSSLAALNDAIQALRETFAQYNTVAREDKAATLKENLAFLQKQAEQQLENEVAALPPAKKAAAQAKHRQLVSHLKALSAPYT